MIFVTSKKAFLDSLKKVSRCSEKKTVAQSAILEIKADVEKGRVFLRKNNLDTCIISAFGASNMEQGTVKVNGQEILDIVSLMPDSIIRVSLEGSKLLVAGKKTKMSLPISTEPFIKWSGEKPIVEARLPEVTFRNLVEQVAYSSASNSDQPIMSSINIVIKDNILTMTACDGRRISKASAEISSTGQDCSCMIPASQLMDVTALLSDIPGENMKFIMSKNTYQLRVTDKTTAVAGRFVNGDYPSSVESVLEKKSPNLIEVDRDVLFDAVERCSYVSKKGGLVPMVMDIGSSLKLSSKSERNEVEDEIFCSIKGKAARIGVDPGYLKEMLRKYPDERVVIGYSSPSEPILLYTSNKGQTLVVFPVLIREAKQKKAKAC